MKRNSVSFWRRVLPVVLCCVLAFGMLMPANAATSPVTYYSTYGSLEEVRAASAEINRQIGEESVVLMKNQNNVLPLKDVRFISVFGKAAEDPFYAGGGSGTAAGYYPDEMYTSIYDSLEAAGYSVNPSLRAFYEKQVDAGALEGDSFSYQVVNGEVTFSGNRAQIRSATPTPPLSPAPCWTPTPGIATPRSSCWAAPVPKAATRTWAAPVKPSSPKN